MLGDDVVLLPIIAGTRKQFGKAMSMGNLTLRDMQDREYLAELNHGGNVGVLLGNGRITIDLDQNTAVEAFLNLNPKLQNTLRTRRVRGCNLWVRIKGNTQRRASSDQGRRRLG